MREIKMFGTNNRFSIFATKKQLPTCSRKTFVKNICYWYHTKHQHSCCSHSFLLKVHRNRRQYTSNPLHMSKSNTQHSPIWDNLKKTQYSARQRATNTISQIKVGRTKPKNEIQFPWSGVWFGLYLTARYRRKTPPWLLKIGHEIQNSFPLSIDREKTRRRVANLDKKCVFTIIHIICWNCCCFNYSCVCI